MDFNIVRSNIINLSVDAIVLPANEKLKEGPGTSKAIFEAAGRSKLKKACEEIGHCDIGMAVPTPAYSLDAKYIIHAVVPRWKGGNNDEYALLSSAYLSSMNLADVLGCESIAFPLLASGNNGFDRALAFKIAAESINKFEGTKLKRVTLVVYGETAECFVRSQGYDVTVIADIERPKKPVIDEEVQGFISEKLKAAADWLKEPDNQKKLLDLGMTIALAVIGKDTKAFKILDAVKKKTK